MANYVNPHTQLRRALNWWGSLPQSLVNRMFEIGGERGVQDPTLTENVISRGGALANSGLRWAVPRMAPYIMNFLARYLSGGRLTEFPTMGRALQYAGDRLISGITGGRMSGIPNYAARLATNTGRLTSRLGRWAPSVSGLSGLWTAADIAREIVGHGAMYADSRQQSLPHQMRKYDKDWSYGDALRYNWNMGRRAMGQLFTGHPIKGAITGFNAIRDPLVRWGGNSKWHSPLTVAKDLYFNRAEGWRGGYQKPAPAIMPVRFRTPRSRMGYGMGFGTMRRSRPYYRTSGGFRRRRRY